MEISAIEALTNAKLEVDRALDKKQTRRCTACCEEIPLECEAVTKAAEPKSIRDKRVYIEVYESEADVKIISGKWIAESTLGTIRTERLRRRREGRRRFRQYDDGSISENATFSQAIDLRSEGYTVFTADVKTAYPQRTCEGR